MKSPLDSTTSSWDNSDSWWTAWGRGSICCCWGEAGLFTIPLPHLAPVDSGSSLPNLEKLQFSLKRATIFNIIRRSIFDLKTQIAVTVWTRRQFCYSECIFHNTNNGYVRLRHTNWLVQKILQIIRFPFVWNSEPLGDVKITFYRSLYNLRTLR